MKKHDLKYLDTPQKVLGAGGVVFSVEPDVAGDDAWFDDHPQATERRRLATPEEVAMSGQIPGIRVIIRKVGPGMKERVFPSRRGTRN